MDSINTNRCLLCSCSSCLNLHLHRVQKELLPSSRINCPRLLIRRVTSSLISQLAPLLGGRSTIRNRVDAPDSLDLATGSIYICTLNCVQDYKTVKYTMKGEKTREEVMAEREAKKKAKLIKKKNLVALSTEDSKSQAPQPTQSGNTTKDAQPQKSETAVAHESGSKAKKNEGKTAKKSGVPSDNQKGKGDFSGQKMRKSHQSGSPTQGKYEEITRSKLVATANMKDGGTSKMHTKKDMENNLKNVEYVSEDGGKTEGMNKAELKAARRMKQEMQRAVKAAQQKQKSQKECTETQPGPQGQGKTSDKKVELKLSKPVPTETDLRKNSLKHKPKLTDHKVKLFNHLYCDDDLSINESVSHVGLHPAIISLGIQYANRIVVGSNARCFSFMNALKKVIEDYTTPQEKEFARGLESYLQPCMAFLQRCRPLAVSMTNAMKHLKWQLTQLPNDVSDEDAKKKLLEAIDTYLRDEIDVAAQAICITVQNKIMNGDVILTYGCSSLVQRILIEAHKNGTEFRVIIVDARPCCEGLQLLHRLSHYGIQCSYVLIGAASCMMREATRVLLGAHALLANGYVMSRAGSSQVALLARTYTVPVLVCCETYKFCERVQTDALVYNEIGDPEALVRCRSEEDVKPLSNWRSVVNLTPLNLTYDVTPPKFVTAVVTELSFLPCTSVPVILRIKP